MKKLTPILILTATISAANAAPLNEAQLAGQWRCTTEYPSIYAAVTDSLTLRPNHYANSIGNYTFRRQGLDFRFQQSATGTWQLSNDTLILVWNSNRARPQHDAATRQTIGNNLELRNIEHRIATILDSDRQAKTITLRIDSLDAGTMRQTQIDDQTGQEMAQSICRRLPN